LWMTLPFPPAFLQCFCSLASIGLVLEVFPSPHLLFFPAGPPPDCVFQGPTKDACPPPPSASSFEHGWNVPCCRLFLWLFFLLFLVELSAVRFGFLECRDSTHPRVWPGIPNFSFQDLELFVIARRRPSFCTCAV